LIIAISASIEDVWTTTDAGAVNNEDARSVVASCIWIVIACGTICAAWISTCTVVAVRIRIEVASARVDATVRVEARVVFDVSIDVVVASHRI
jgi:hypothetical protein